MSDIRNKRDRSPAFPQVPLGEATERLVAFEKYFGRHAVPVEKAGLAWKLKQAGDILASLRYYGFIDYIGKSESRQIVITDDGRGLIRTEQRSARKQLLKKAALRPREMAKFWTMWGTDRPPDPLCLDQLRLHNGFSDRGAPLFLQSYDATIAFAGLAEFDKLSSDVEGNSPGEDGNEHTREFDNPRPAMPWPSPSLFPDREMTIMDGEREFTTGLLSKDTSFRLIVKGTVGVKEIDRLIRKLQLDKEIMAEAEETEVARARVDSDDPSRP